MIAFKPLSPLFWVEAAGVDLSQPLAEEIFRELEQAFYAHQVLAIRGGRRRQPREVQHWQVWSPIENRNIWRRNTQETTAWRFGRYADRALDRSASCA